MRKYLYSIIQLIFIVLLFVILYVFSMFQGGFVSWFLLFSFLPIGLYHILLLFYPLNRLNVSRKLSSYVSEAGTSVSVTIHLKRRIPFPIYFFVCEEMLAPSLQNFQKGFRKRSNVDTNNKKRGRVKRILFPWFKRNIKMTYTLHDISRGKHVFEGIRVWTGDVFGFIHKETTFFVPDECIVYPKEYPVYFMKTFISVGEGDHHSAAYKRANSNLATGVREYVPGDKAGWINWKQTARMNKVMTKEFEHEYDNDTTIILDACAGEKCNEAGFEEAVSLCYSLFMSKQDRIGEMNFISVGEEIISSGHSENKLDRIHFQTHLLQVKQKEGYVFADRLKTALLQTFRTNNRIFLLVTSIEESLVEELEKMNKQIREFRIILVQPQEQMNRATTNRIASLRKRGIITTTLSEQSFIGENVEVNLA